MEVDILLLFHMLMLLRYYYQRPKPETEAESDAKAEASAKMLQNIPVWGGCLINCLPIHASTCIGVCHVSIASGYHLVALCRLQVHRRAWRSTKRQAKRSGTAGSYRSNWGQYMREIIEEPVASWSWSALPIPMGSFRRPIHLAVDKGYMGQDLCVLSKCCEQTHGFCHWNLM